MRMYMSEYVRALHKEIFCLPRQNSPCIHTYVCTCVSKCAVYIQLMVLPAVHAKPTFDVLLTAQLCMYLATTESLLPCQPFSACIAPAVVVGVAHVVHAYVRVI